MTEKAKTDQDPKLDDLEDLAEQSGTVDLDRDIQWSYSHIADETVGPQDAPSGSAWFFLEYGRQARTKYMEIVIRHFSDPKRQVSRKVEEVKPDMDKAIKLLKEIARPFHSEEDWKIISRTLDGEGER